MMRANGLDPNDGVLHQALRDYQSTDGYNALEELNIPSLSLDADSE
jgi:hypothetical protein